MVNILEWAVPISPEPRIRLIHNEYDIKYKFRS